MASACHWQNLPNKIDHTDQYDHYSDRDACDNQRWFCHLFVIYPPLMYRVTIDGVHPSDRGASWNAPFVLLIAFFLGTHCIYSNKISD